MESRQLPVIIKIWQRVIVTPEVSKIKVFNKGIPNGEKHLIPTGGQTPPIKGDGARLEWKKAQKNETKNITSEAMNSMKPNFKPRCTAKVWYPESASLKILKAHFNKLLTTTNKTNLNNQLKPQLWKIDTPPKAIENTPQAVIKGKGLVGSIWKGCDLRIFFLLEK